jgi:hypothetical protein
MELLETRSQIDKEIESLHPFMEVGSGSTNAVGCAGREKTPEEIISDIFSYHPVQDEANKTLEV